MSSYVDAVAYDQNKDHFLMAKKNTKGNYFGLEDGRGVLIPQGRQLYNGGTDVPSGGELLDEELDLGAMREFEEETAVNLDDYSFSTTPSAFHGFNDQDDFWGVYFPLVPTVGGVARVKLLTGQVQRHLTAGHVAAAAVQAGQVKKYTEFRAEFPDAPLDNELASAHVWNLKTDWAVVESWRDSPTHDWFYDILFNLRYRLGIPPQGAENEGVTHRQEQNIRK